jgi:outer membrane protein assembly factor BamB
LLAISAGLLVVIGSVVGYTKLDLERYHSNPSQLRKLTAAQFPAVDPLPASASDWPQWRGLRRDGVSLETGLLTTWPTDGPRVVWRKPLGRGFSSIAVAAGRLITMCEQAVDDKQDGNKPSSYHEAVVCWDAETGQEHWSFRYPNHFHERFGSGPRSTPAVDGDCVYAVGPTGIFHCLKAATGEKVWRHDLMQEFQGRPMQYGVSFSPLVEGDLVYTMPGGPSGNAVAAFDKRSGALAWKALDDPIGYSSPIAITAAGVRQILVFTNAALVSLSPADGKVLWRFPWVTADGFNIATPLGFGNYVFISSAYGKGCALVEITAQADGGLDAGLVYEHNRMRNHFASSVRHGDYIYGFDQTDLVCMKIRSGKIMWREKGARSFGKATLIIADGHLIIMGEDGRLVLAEATPEGYREKASFQITQFKCWTVPAISAGKLYFRNEAEAACLDLRR